METPSFLELSNVYDKITTSANLVSTVETNLNILFGQKNKYDHNSQKKKKRLFSHFLKKIQ